MLVHNPILASDSRRKQGVKSRDCHLLCNTPKKEGCAFRNIGKNISLDCVISLANFRLLFNLLLIRSSTARGSGTSILLRWSLQKLTSKEIVTLVHSRLTMKHLMDHFQYHKCLFGHAVPLMTYNMLVKMKLGC